MSEILVVGAGPVGLTMAAELARHGAPCRIIDRLPAPSGYCKALGVTPRTLEVWEEMGVSRPMIDAGLWLQGLRLIVNGEMVREVPAGLPGLPYGFTLGLPQYETERILAAHLESFGIAVERGVELAGLDQDGQGVDVRLRHADGRSEEVRFAHVVGCDGARSTVRKALGIGFDGDAFPVEFMLGDVAVEWTAPRGTAVRAVQMTGGEMSDFLVAVPLPDQDRYRLTTYVPDELAQPVDPHSRESHGILSERATPTLAHLQAVIDRLVPGTILSDLRWSSIFRISMRLAEAYRRGRVFIAGDAAHIHPPTGGQGMNTGIQDAYNLAWKLALHVRGAAADGLLDSYEAERRPVGQEVVARTLAQTQAFRSGQPGGKGGGNAQMEDSQLLVNYRGGSWVGEDLDPDLEAVGPAAGDRAPDADGLTRAGLGFPQRLFEILRGPDHVLLARIADPQAARDVAALVRDLRRRFGGGIRGYGIVAPGREIPSPPGLPLLVDQSQAFSRAYDDLDRAGWLVRPDGHVGYRTTALAAPRLIAHLERILTLRPCAP
ncbi:FAD-dependent monooxygenase [Geminicoccus roseus]|uniref:FAD-dependent monooxygenase n=1 Tax=Geminicoccus roseus TaxID=404900 RepID=UPI00042386EA|nr:FAD-dependent monooxygenase [Geminicoccus roseus]